MKKGKFIVLEGGDGAGKGTVVKHLQKFLPKSKFVFSREPGGTMVGEKVREILLGEEMSPVTELMLHFSYRFEHIEKVIIPNLKKGIHVVSERYIASTYAYQIEGWKRPDLLPLFRMLEKECDKLVRPDLYLFLDLDAKEGERRLKNKGQKLDRFELAGLAFHERVRKAYHKYLKEHPSVLVEAGQGLEGLLLEVETIIRNKTLGKTKKK